MNLSRDEDESGEHEDRDAHRDETTSHRFDEERIEVTDQRSSRFCNVM